MAWTSPSTAVAGTVLTAATWNAQVRSNMQALLPLDALAWSSYTPTLTQSATPSKTVTRGKYTRLGNLIVVSLVLDVTGAGTANNAVVVGLPVTAVSATGAMIGAGKIFDASVVGDYPGLCVQASTTTFTFMDATQAVAVKLGQTGAAFALALANLDQVVAHVVYEAA